ncbi:MAG: hypothetical protein Q7S83_02425 [bacterium]|nr:hypothetical protein [bacterium]
MKITEEFKKKAKEAVKRGVLFGYCPQHLSIEGKDAMWMFPENIVFANFRDEPDGSRTMGSAVYNPDLRSLSKNKAEWRMTYRNLYGGDSNVVITIKIPALSYTGDKFVNGVLVGSATGILKGDEVGVAEGWKLFFFELTLLGLAEGEQCRSEKVEDREASRSFGFSL